MRIAHKFSVKHTCSFTKNTFEIVRRVGRFTCKDCYENKLGIFKE